MSTSEPSDLYRVQRVVGDWSAATFPHQTFASKIAHLREELDELERDPTNGEEAADCAILLLGIAHLAGYSLFDAIIAKLAILMHHREWGPPDEHGVSHHIKKGESS